MRDEDEQLDVAGIGDVTALKMLLASYLNKYFINTDWL